MAEKLETAAQTVIFRFGKNWQRFLKTLDQNRITEAQRSLNGALQIEDFSGKSFLDIGSGSGLFSLAARRLGAHVHSFDYDPQSVDCTKELRRRYFADDGNWTIEEGSVLDARYVQSLGEFDIVYSWGVLHHTGAMWEALTNAMIPVRKGGILYIAIYNDQGVKSRGWRRIKRYYCSNTIGRILIILVFAPLFCLAGIAVDTFNKRNPIRRYTEYNRCRGMSVWTDWLDWLGGYPFEVASPDEVIDYCKDKGLKLVTVKTCGKKMGNNEYIFVKI